MTKRQRVKKKQGTAKQPKTWRAMIRKMSSKHMVILHFSNCDWSAMCAPILSMMINYYDNGPCCSVL